MRKVLPKLSPRHRRGKYLTRTLLALLLTLAAGGGLVVADRMGAFGRADTPDWTKYHNITFAVVRAVDGDTLDLQVEDGVNKRPSTRVRLWGVDTPETVKPNLKSPDHFGPEASAFTKELVVGKSVRIELEGRQSRDKYNRLLAFVYLPDGRMLNRLLVEEGYAYADPRFAHTYSAEFKRLQQEAMKSRRGLWRNVKQSDLPAYLGDKIKLDM